MTERSMRICRWGECSSSFPSQVELEQHVEQHLESSNPISLRGIKRRKINAGVWLRTGNDVASVAEVSHQAITIVSDSQAGNTTTTTDTTFPFPSLRSLPPPPSFPSPPPSASLPPEALHEFGIVATGSSIMDDLDASQSMDLIAGAEMYDEHGLPDDVLGQFIHSRTPSPSLDQQLEAAVEAGPSSSPAVIARRQGSSTSNAIGVSPHHSLISTPFKRARERSISPFVPPTQAEPLSQVADQPVTEANDATSSPLAPTYGQVAPPSQMLPTSQEVPGSIHRPRGRRSDSLTLPMQFGSALSTPEVARSAGAFGAATGTSRPFRSVGFSFGNRLGSQG